MKSIWKFSAPIADRTVIFMPKGAKPLCVQTQDGLFDPQLWAEVNVDVGAEVDRREFLWIGTENQMPEVGRYIGTIQQGRFVFHLFEAPDTQKGGE